MSHQDNLKEYYRILFENAQDSIFINDLKGVFVDGNKRAEEMLGSTKEKIIGKSLLQLKLVPKKEIPKAMANFAKIKLGHAVGPEEYTLNRTDGSTVTIEVRNYPIKIDGKTMSMGIARDISKRKDAEAALSKTDNIFQTIVNNAQIGIMVFDPDLNIQLANSEAERILGIKKDNLIDRSINDLDLKFISQKRQNIATNANPIYRVKKNRKALKEYKMGIIKSNTKYVVWTLVNATPILLEKKQLARIIVSFIDITSQVRDKNEIESLAKFPAENPNPILRIDYGGTILYANKPALRLYSNDLIKVGAKAPEKWQKILNISNENKEEIEPEIEIGSKIFHFTISRIEDEKYINLYLSDITEQKQAETDILQRNQELEDFRKITLGRELKMIELKRKIESLEEKILELSTDSDK